jgi:hypothetical protein
VFPLPHTQEMVSAREQFTIAIDVDANTTMIRSEASIPRR